jgi:hypothetical protein
LLSTIEPSVVDIVSKKEIVNFEIYDDCDVDDANDELNAISCLIGELSELHGLVNCGVKSLASDDLLCPASYPANCENIELNQSCDVVKSGSFYDDLGIQLWRPVKFSAISPFIVYTTESNSVFPSAIDRESIICGYVSNFENNLALCSQPSVYLSSMQHVIITDFNPSNTTTAIDAIYPPDTECITMSSMTLNDVILDNDFSIAKFGIIFVSLLPWVQFHFNKSDGIMFFNSVFTYYVGNLNFVNIGLIDYVANRNPVNIREGIGTSIVCISADLCTPVNITEMCDGGFVVSSTLMIYPDLNGIFMTLFLSILLQVFYANFCRNICNDAYCACYGCYTYFKIETSILLYGVVKYVEFYRSMVSYYINCESDYSLAFILQFFDNFDQCDDFTNATDNVSNLPNNSESINHVGKLQGCDNTFSNLNNCFNGHELHSALSINNNNLICETNDYSNEGRDSYSSISVVNIRCNECYYIIQCESSYSNKSIFFHNKECEAKIQPPSNTAIHIADSILMISTILQNYIELKIIRPSVPTSCVSMTVTYLMDLIRKLLFCKQCENYVFQRIKYISRNYKWISLNTYYLEECLRLLSLKNYCSLFYNKDLV